MLNTRRDKNGSGLLAKTIGSSLKKHIFAKGFLSKTPKAARGDTPVSSHSKVKKKKQTYSLLYSLLRFSLLTFISFIDS